MLIAEKNVFIAGAIQEIYIWCLMSLQIFVSETL